MSLKDYLIRQIMAEGPMRLSSYMQACLLHPEFGYYATRDPFGTKGDFITAPEISQMFGEMVGLCLAQHWLDQGGGRMVLVELGPGRGTLMRDVLRAMKSAPGLEPEVHLVEASPALRQIQRKRLGKSVTWHNAISTLPEGPLYVLANEFFDALPIRQFRRTEKGWVERAVSAKKDTLFIGEVPAQGPAHRLNDTKSGDIVEVCPQAGPMIDEVSRRIQTYGGMALIVDYGGWRSLGDTFQAVKNHQPIDPLEAPGEADLTAHVDFEALAQAATCEVTPFVTQGTLLENLGITMRAKVLAAMLKGKALDEHYRAYHRLTHPSEMGTLFKAIALYQKGATPPSGFEP